MFTFFGAKWRIRIVERDSSHMKQARKKSVLNGDISVKFILASNSESSIGDLQKIRYLAVEFTN